MTVVTDVMHPPEATEPTETKGERTRRRLLEIAVKRFGRQGYRSTSVSEIARGAGLTQAAAYAYFSNKEELFFEAVDADAGDLVDEAMRQVTDVPGPELVPALVLTTVDLLDHHPLARRVLAGQEPDVLARLVEIPALERFARFLAERVVAGQENGDVRDDIDPGTIGAGMETLVLGLLFSIVQSGGLATPRHQQGVVAAFRAMLAPR